MLTQFRGTAIRPRGATVAAHSFAHSHRSGYLWSAAGVIAATGGFWLAHAYVDKGQASLLYLPVVIACAIRFGFGPAVLAAMLSFICCIPTRS